MSKIGSGSPGEGFSAITEGLLTAGVSAWTKNVSASTRVGVYFQSPEGNLLDSGHSYSTARAVGRNVNLPAAYETHLEAFERIGLERVSQTIG
jgi:hypothetical protein